MAGDGSNSGPDGESDASTIDVEELVLRLVIGGSLLEQGFPDSDLSYSLRVAHRRSADDVAGRDATPNGDGCGFVQWYDSPLPKFFSDLIGDLRDEVWRLRGQDNVPPVSVEQVEECRDQLVSVEPTVKDLKDQLKEKSAEIAALKGNFEKVVFIVLVFVFGVVAGKLFAF
ncbi:hypothetical protein D1007_36620 [Hordeum vulgare]|nr:hypothetical protein D1007_36620 [Hordeum vulgare]